MAMFGRKSEKYISFAEAGRQFGLRKDYLRLLVFRRRLQAVKIGRNWFTTAAWVNEYLGGQGQKTPYPPKGETKISAGIATPPRFSLRAFFKNSGIIAAHRIRRGRDLCNAVERFFSPIILRHRRAALAALIFLLAVTGIVAGATSPSFLSSLRRAAAIARAPRAAAERFGNFAITARIPPPREIAETSERMAGDALHDFISFTENAAAIAAGAPSYFQHASLASIRQDLRDIFTKSAAPDPEAVIVALKTIFDRSFAFRPPAFSFSPLLQFFGLAHPAPVAVTPPGALFVPAPAETPAPERAAATTTPSTAAVPAPAAPAIREVITRKEIVAPADVSSFQTKLDALNSYILTQFSRVNTSLADLGVQLDAKTSFTTFARSEKIDQLIAPSILSGLTLSGDLSSTGSFTFSGSGRVNGGLTVDGALSSGALSASSGTFSGNLTVAGDLTVSGAQTLSGAITIPYFTATSTTATSTIATGGFAVGTSQFVVQQTSGYVGIGTSTPAEQLYVSGAVRVVGNAIDFASGSAGLNLDYYGGSGRIGTVNGGGTGGPLSFFTNSNRVAVFDTSGNFGIASNTPWGLLSVNPNGISSAAMFAIGSSTATQFVVSNQNGSYGNVGIGTTSPGSLLSVNGPILAQTGTSTFGGLISPTLFSTTTLGFYTASNATPRMTIDASGNVGIGTTSPWAQLSVNPNGISGPEFSVGSSTKTDLVVTNGGNTGIGTQNPTYKLHVAQGLLNETALFENTGGTITSILLKGTGGTSYISQHGNALALTAGSATWNNTHLWIDSTGKIGIDTAVPKNVLDVNGAAAIGSYAGVNTAPSNGLIVSGNVGIGTAGPGLPLDVVGVPTAGGDLLRLRNNGGVSGDVLLGGSNTPSTNSIALKSNYGANSGIAFSTKDGSGSANINMVITGAGNVGIGSTTPGSLLAVNGPILAQTGTSTFGGLISPTLFSTTTLGFYTASNATPRMTIDASGNVGIGTTSPGSTLEIGSGQIRIPDGSNSAPSVTFSNAPTTGFYRNAPNNALRIAIAGTNFASLESGGSLWLTSDTATIDFGLSQHSLILSREDDNTLRLGESTTATQIFKGYNGFGTDKAGGNITFAAGRSTGAGLGGSLFLATSPAGTTGSSLNALVTRLMIDSSGNVGIGTTSPTSLLSVNGPILAQTGTSTFGGLISPTLFSTTTLGFYTASNATPRMTVDASGNVGIGTTNPGNKLTVLSSTEGDGIFVREADNGNNAVGLIGDNGGGEFALYRNGTANVYFDASGAGHSNYINTGANVGIGTTSPMGTLSVGSGQLIVQSGSVSAPGLGFGNEKNTGIYNANAGQLNVAIQGIQEAQFSGAGTLSLLNNGARLLFGAMQDIAFTRVTGGLNISGGNVGIGTTTPGVLFSVGGALLANGEARIAGVLTAAGAINSTVTGIQTAGTTRLDTSGNLSNIAALSLSGAISGGTTITGTTINGTTGINTGAGAGTQRIDASGNLSNIGTIGSTYLTTSANIVNFSGVSTVLQLNGTQIMDASRNMSNIGTISAGTYNSQTISSAASFTGTITAAGAINSTVTGIQTAGTTRLDTSGNLSNIAALSLSGAISGGTSYSGSGNITSTGGTISMSGAGNNYFAGNVGIGQTATHALSVNGEIKVNGIYGNQDTLTAAFSFSGATTNTTWTIGNTPAAQSSWNLQVNSSAAKPGGGQWSDSSDRRIKTNIKPVTNALDKLLLLNPVTFDWINPELHKGAEHPGGFIAQEIMQVFPDFVNSINCLGAADCALTGGEGSKEYDLTLPFKFDAYLVGGIKELASTTVSLQNQINDLNSNLYAMSPLASSSPAELTTNAWSVSQTSGKVNVNFFGDVSLNGNAIINVSKIIGMWGKWTIDENGVLTAKEIHAERIVASASAEFGSPALPIGITIYDRATKEPVCVFSEHGALRSEAGACDSTSLAASGSQSATATTTSASAESGVAAPTLNASVGTSESAGSAATATDTSTVDMTAPTGTLQQATTTSPGTTAPLDTGTTAASSTDATSTAL